LLRVLPRLGLPTLCLIAACGKAPTPDAGVPDAGADAGPTCLDPDSGTPDAGDGDGGDLSCLNQPLPAGAVSHLTISGFVTAAGLARKPVEGAQVELYDEAGTQVLSTAVSAPDGGTWSVDTDIGCAPFLGSLRASDPDAGFSDAWYYPAAPFRHDRAALELVVFDAAAQGLIAAIAQVTIQPGTGALALGVDDCSGHAMFGATVASSPAGKVRYVSEQGLPSPMGTATSSKGQALIFNVPPGSVELTATVNGQTLRSKTVTVRDGTITATTLTP
jgi:hypothetical protein